MNDTESTLVMPALNRDTFLARLVSRLKVLPEHSWDVTIKPHKAKRTSDQNSLLWALYADALKLGGETLGGWTKDDIHEYMLGEHFGWDVCRAFDTPRKKPKHRSSKLNKQEFSDFVEFVVQRFAEHGIVLELPGDLP